jgi:hypothetical protein
MWLEEEAKVGKKEAGEVRRNVQRRNVERWKMEEVISGSG